MAKYGMVAVRAAGLMLWEPGTHPDEAWTAAAERVFPNSPSSREKGCPKGAFLGLCEEGVISGVPPGEYTRSVLNKEYALRALEALRARPDLIGDPKQLWRKATNGKDIRANSQMDVLAALWQLGLVR